MLNFIFIFGTFFVLNSHISQFSVLAAEVDFQKAELEGIFEPNDKLSHGTKIIGMNAPESIVEDDYKNLYTGFADGRIVRIAPSSDGIIGQGEITNITTGILFNKAATVKEEVVGMPLGLRIIGDVLYVADANHGVYSVNIVTQEVTSLVALDSVDPPLGFPNDLCLAKDGKTIYFTDSISRNFYNAKNGKPFADLCKGRVLQYNVETQEINTMLTGLCFANGLQLSDDEKLIFVSELQRNRFRIVDLESLETKTVVEVPMPADNIRATGKGTYLVAGSLLGSTSKSEENSQLDQQTHSKKFLRASPTYHNIAVEFTDTGEVVQTLQDTEAEVPMSQASKLSDGRLALGSYRGSILFIADV